ncbi:ComEC/Rec2 family competence protein [Cognatitamlana onchidii]|uniref:ComEC/Rec2 family competence protein n=1 Tax=Cognatitamlana onchidii TaxID=2562860 RepID=UPI001F1B30BF|nr:ComEC/Rec2 family competence protein [Algibacter onchidii]
MLLAAYTFSKNRIKKTIWFGVISMITMLSIGILIINFHNPKNNPDHYSHYISNSLKNNETICFRIREVLKPGLYYNKYIIDIISINDNPVSGRLLLNIKKSPHNVSPNVDDTYITRSSFKNLTSPLNPHQFDYKNYLKKNYIYQQLFIDAQNLLNTNSSKLTLLGVADHIRDYVNLKLESYHFSHDELAIINALLLGQRQEISQEVYSNYSNAGAIHILAVSGLHIGIILILLNFVLKPLEYYRRGKLIKMLIIICLLWSFALITGLSASVTRAVTMFSILAIATNLKRPTNIYNTLAISMLIILLCKPLFLFDIGFQLSYAAVFAIVLIDPFLYKLWQPSNKLFNLYWHTLTITISAQLGIIPISLYYFHQFPGLFFISNLIIVPLLGFILGYGILVLILAAINVLPQALANFYGFVIETMNSFVKWIATQETFLFKDISFPVVYVFTFYFLILTLIRFLIKQNYQTLKWLLISILILQLGVVYNAISTTSNEFVIFHKSRHTILGNLQNRKAQIAHDFDNATKSGYNIIKDYKIGKQIREVAFTKVLPVYRIDNKNLLVIDSLGVYKPKSFKPDYVLITQSPKINLTRLIDSLQPKYIIADGSNYPSYIKRWSNICLEKNTSFHQTSKDGAFVIRQ